MIEDTTQGERRRSEALHAGGDVRVDSAPGDGASVAVAPARSGSARSPAPAEDGGPEPPRGTETVLVCEDEPAVRGLLERLLARHGFEVLSAGHPAQALGIAQAHPGPIHALISDMVMPDMLGTELAARIALLRPDLRVLLTSGYTTEALGDMADMPPGTAFIEKPFRGDQLVTRLREVLDDREGRPSGGRARD